MDIHDTVGIDLVAMVVDDLVACGAEPLFLLDYIACGEVVPDQVAEIGAGIADGCRYAGCALLGGETAEHPGVLRPDEYDISGTGVGVVEEDAILGRDRVEVGDVVIAMRSVRPALQRVLAGPARAAGRRPDAAGHGRSTSSATSAPSARNCSRPTKIYARGLPRPASTSATCARSPTSPAAASPATWSGCCPSTVDAVVDRSTWRPQPIFELVQTKGRIDDLEMESTFNMGVGMIAIVAAGRRRPDAGLPAPAAASTRGRSARSSRAPASVQMVGSHTRG